MNMVDEELAEIFASSFLNYSLINNATGIIK